MHRLLRRHERWAQLMEPLLLETSMPSRLCDVLLARAPRAPSTATAAMMVRIRFIYLCFLSYRSGFLFSCDFTNSCDSQKPHALDSIPQSYYIGLDEVCRRSTSQNKCDGTERTHSLLFVAAARVWGTGSDNECFQHISQSGETPDCGADFFDRPCSNLRDTGVGRHPC